MISDKERRRIANELREAASAKGKRSGSMERMLSKLLGIAKQDRGVFGQKVYVAATWRDVYRSLADLIDRPTTKRDGAGGIYWRCTRCGAFNRKDAVTDCCGVIPSRYCANCGAVVVSDYD